jgi:gamma-glutamylcyclotransferase (GGCT)/AIG2-like uncharacterized protein YtfP
MLYFAYGSNLNLRAMAYRCPRAKPLTVARLDGYRLVFRRYADISPDPKGTVWGALFDLTPACLHVLDKYEDEASNLYRKITVTVTRAEEACEAMAYIMDKGPIAPPDVAYYGEIARGYRDWKLDEALLRRARLATLHPQPAQKAKSVKPLP